MLHCEFIFVVVTAAEVILVINVSGVLPNSGYSAFLLHEIGRIVIMIHGSWHLLFLFGCFA